MENECKKYIDKGPLNVIVVVWSDRGGPGPLAPPLNPRLSQGQYAEKSRFFRYFTKKYVKNEVF